MTNPISSILESQNVVILDGALATDARAWFEAGANMIGGCCRTNPEHIRALKLEIPLIQTPIHLEQ